MEFPIVIKKKNSVMIVVSIIEILMGIIFAITSGGLKSVLLWIFIFVGVVTALTVLTEYSMDIILKENKIEFYKFNDLIKSIKYSSIKSIEISKGNEPKTQKKDFLGIRFNENDSKKSKDLKECVYLINFMHYSSQDFAQIRDVILKKNSSVIIGENLDKFIK